MRDPAQDDSFSFQGEYTMTPEELDALVALLISVLRSILGG